MAHHSSYAVQTAAMFVGAIPTLGALAVIVGAQVEKAKRSTPVAGLSVVAKLAEQASQALTGRSVATEPT